MLNTWILGRRTIFLKCLYSEKVENIVSNTKLKGHGNEADFVGFLQKSVRHRLFTLHFKPFRFGLRIRGDIRNRKTTPRHGESTRMLIDTIFVIPLNKSMVIVYYIPGFFFVKKIF